MEHNVCTGISDVRYFSPRLLAALTGILSSPLTVIEAPMGYGKTVAVREFLRRENPKKLKIEEIEAAQLVRALPDVDLAIINGNYAILGGLKVADALSAEKADSIAATTYANILAVRAGDENRPELKALIDALKSDQVKEFMTKKYEGAVVPAN